MKSLVFLLLFTSFQAFAYIPDYSLIMSRLAENHGRGYYKITQDVVFPADPEPLIIEETWYISGEGDMSVFLKGKGALKDLVSGSIVYKNDRKYYQNNGVKVARLSGDFIEPIFHFRYSKRMKPKLVAMNIAPADSLKPRPLFDGEDASTFPTQSFLRLSRTGGFVTYAVGTPTPPDQAEENAGIWIEQDRFNVRKVRTSSTATVVAANYNRYPRKFWFPKTRQYTWENHAVQALVGSVNPLPRNNKSAMMVNPKRFKNDLKEPELRLPDQDMIRDFYKRFR